MSSARAVPLDVTQITVLEEIGMELVRAGDVRAPVVLSVVLQWRSLGRPAFAFEPDESAGLADVVELHGWSKQVPCA